MGFSYLCKRNNCYYFRIRVPKDLKTHLEISEIKKSLSTKYYSLAVSLAKQWAFKTEKLFTLIRLGVLTDVQLRQLIDQELQSKQQALESPPNLPVNSNIGKLFTTIVDKYVIDKQISESWTEKTKQENTASFELFIRVISDKSIKQYNREDFINFKTTLAKLPPGLNTQKQFKGKSIDKVLALKPEITLSKRTINKRMIHVSSVFRWAVLNHYIATSYASELMLPVTGSAQDDKSTYNPEDLQNIVRHLPHDNKHPERFWIPLIAMFTGARINGDMSTPY